ncbi:hypothetical protein [Roseomonas haemaphysalidis]|nr:hypothetical protein [Roseomonas haemaphysalidis]
MAGVITTTPRAVSSRAAKRLAASPVSATSSAPAASDSSSSACQSPGRPFSRMLSGTVPVASGLAIAAPLPFALAGEVGPEW